MQLVTDRSRADVTYVQTLVAKICNGTATEAELAQWNGAALKGSYNATDFNRVGVAMEYVADRFHKYGYRAAIAPKLDWKETDMPVPTDVERYLSDLAVLRGIIAVMQSTPEVPAHMDGFTYVEANNIEKILEDIDLLLTRAAQAWFYGGDVFSGEV